MKPTAYFRLVLPSGDERFARWYWPESRTCEVYSNGGWVERPLLLDLTEDPEWERVDESDVTVPTT